MHPAREETRLVRHAVGGIGEQHEARRFGDLARQTHRVVRGEDHEVAFPPSVTCRRARSIGPASRSSAYTFEGLDRRVMGAVK